MINQFSRTELLIGQSGLEKLKNSRVAVFGLGGVGGYVAEALARSGIGTLDLIDNDKISLTNLNRQIYALYSTIGQYKVDVAEKRILDINPDIKVRKYITFYTPDTKSEFDFSQYDYVVDAIDTVVAKLSLIEETKKYNVPIICSMGTGNKLDPTKFEISDISKTSVCPLARVIRQELKKRKISKVKVVFSKEQPIKAVVKSQEDIPSGKQSIPGSSSFVPAVAGMIIASEVVKDLIKS